jgi:hypothetical protein
MNFNFKNLAKPLNALPSATKARRHGGGGGGGNPTNNRHLISFPWNVYKVRSRTK